MSGAPPSKQARFNGSQEDEETSGAQRGSPRQDDDRGRRIANRRPSDEVQVGGTGQVSAPREVHPARNLNTADIIVVDAQEAASAAGGSAAAGGLARGGYRGGPRERSGAREPREPRTELVLACPETTRVTNLSKFREINVMANFVNVQPMKERAVYQYRVEYSPQIESRQNRRCLFREATKELFSKIPGFDGMHDIYCSQKLPNEETKVSAENPLEKGQMVELKITRVGTVDWGSMEMMRCYNMHMKRYLQLMGFYQITATGSWVHSDLATPVGDGKSLSITRGFKTAANVFDGGKIRVCLESVHKIMQRRNVLEVMAHIRQSRPANLREALKSELTGKLVITNYNKRIYRVEDVRFDVKPTDTFNDKRDAKPISYIDYFKQRHNERILDIHQPLLQVVPNNKRGKNERGPESQTREILLVPELCNITGLTEDQRTDNRLKMDLIRINQVAPGEKVRQIRAFLEKFHSNVDIRDHLKQQGYSYDKDGFKLKAHVLPITKIGYRADSMNPVNATTADFSVNDLACVPKLDNLVVVITRIDLGQKETIMGNLKRGFGKVKLRPNRVVYVDVQESDSPANYIKHLRDVPSDVTAIIVVMHNQNKEKYDSIKKVASVERGLITQVITARLMTDQKKAASAATKIAIQVAAKIGGEPWWADIPLKKAMICGYDTSRDTAKRGVTYGAFLASMNDKYSRWYSKADMQDQSDQISNQLTDALSESLKKYKEINGAYPDRVFIYRDGVSEGMLGTIVNTELVRLKETLERVAPGTRLTVTIVNKRAGARFFMHTGNDQFANCPPGTVIDHSVTRLKRFDFYLISQSTRNGTVAPTYYTVIHSDEPAMLPEHHQMLAYKLTLMYFNWSGTVRVPAPCQYAQKLASLCGENLHAAPNAVLNDRLHFL